MARVSITRLRLRSAWFGPPFFWRTLRSQAQAKRADGCLAVALRRHNGAFWTMTLWRNSAALRGFMLSGAHKAAMPKLKRWCDEASLTHWEQIGAALPSWDEAERRLATEGRTSRVDHPSGAQAAEKTLGK